MLQDVNRAIRQTKRYWYEDGLVEVATGCLFLLGVAILLVNSMIIFPAVSASSIAALVVGCLLFVAMIVVGGQGNRIYDAIQILKDRLVYPRTGYVEYAVPEPPKRSPLVGILVIFFVSGFTAAILGILLTLASSAFKISDWLMSMPMAESFMTCIMVAILGYRMRIVRFYLMGAFALFAGVVAALPNAGDAVGTAIYFAIMGIALIISGLIALLVYLRRPAPTEER